LAVATLRRGTLTLTCTFNPLRIERGNLFKDLGLKPKHIPNFVCGDAQHLPFRDGVFSLVCSSHVMEHVADLGLMVRELMHVSCYQVVIKCPHRLLRAVSEGRIKEHVNHFGKAWFYGFRRMGVFVSVEVSRFRNFPHEYSALLHLPYEITVHMIKK